MDFYAFSKYFIVTPVKIIEFSKRTTKDYFLSYLTYSSNSLYSLIILYILYRYCGTNSIYKKW